MIVVCCQECYFIIAVDHTHISILCEVRKRFCYDGYLNHCYHYWTVVQLPSVIGKLVGKQASAAETHQTNNHPIISRQITWIQVITKVKL